MERGSESSSVAKAIALLVSSSTTRTSHTMTSSSSSLDSSSFIPTISSFQIPEERKIIVEIAVLIVALIVIPVVIYVIADYCKNMNKQEGSLSATHPTENQPTLAEIDQSLEYMRLQVRLLEAQRNAFLARQGISGDTTTQQQTPKDETVVLLDSEEAVDSEMTPGKAV